MLYRLRQSSIREHPTHVSLSNLSIQPGTSKLLLIPRSMPTHAHWSRQTPVGRFYLCLEAASSGLRSGIVENTCLTTRPCFGDHAYRCRPASRHSLRRRSKNNHGRNILRPGPMFIRQNIDTKGSNKRPMGDTQWGGVKCYSVDPVCSNYELRTYIYTQQGICIFLRSVCTRVGEIAQLLRLRLITTLSLTGPVSDTKSRANDKLPTQETQLQRSNIKQSHMRTMDAVALSVMPRKLVTVSDTVTSTPTSSTVTLIVASKEPLKGPKASRSGSSAAIGVPVESAMSQTAESAREAPPELVLPSNVTSPQRPAVCIDMRIWS